MNVKRLGVPIYENSKGQKYILPADLKLALDSDVYDRILSKKRTMVVDDATKQAGFDVEWLERQY